MKALIIGTGAVGCAIAIAAANAGMKTAVFAGSATAQYIREYGLKRTGIFGELSILPECITVYDDYDQIASGYDYVVPDTIMLRSRSRLWLTRLLPKHLQHIAV